ncbi:endonuclease/exonuclease/phosphatase family protein [Dyadobacter sediminis]|uniref:Endonuclease/exonuclease/phosphatase family protein n=1 Tax=Dyadobacter sediminis TaxID=1493691 RepID=A0A5R9KBS4_9BACT|nr:endonuclease/exonuclease/phosphatase family protein [Dyadobacter sediminis]TLU92202.1 endonuclease/exonuclease/phosphatase family protein [Dyadobacter sediminis]GGB96581.1 endonuclease [Dyadobacter sediminis]
MNTILKKAMRVMRLFPALFLVISLHSIQAQSMRIMSYNIRYKNAADSINGWEYRKENVAALIRYHKADLLGVQEAQPDQMADLEKLLPEFSWYGVPRVSGKSGEFTAVFYRKERYKLISSGTFWYSETPNVKESKSWDAFYPRTASWCKFTDKKSKKTFFFFNTHLDHHGVLAREKSAEVLLAQMDSIAEKLPVLVTGDFNAGPASAAYKTLTEGKKLLDTYDISATPHYGPVNTSSGFDVKKEPIRSRIDYIFVNAKVKVLEHATLSDQQEGRYYSDHLPVIAEIELIK